MSELGIEPLARFRAALGHKLGLAFEEQRLGQLAEVFDERVARRGGDAEAYLEWLASASPGEELASIASRMTVPETYFFRHPQQFEALRALLARHPRSAAPPRVASLGCASGEEAYSLAITLRELWPEREASVVAADVNPAILELARAARYSAWSLRETPPALVQRWFTKQGREYVLDDSIRRAVRFVRANLAADDAELLAPGSLDVIFCRNVLMYFTPESFRAAVRRIALALAPGGHLFLGSAETLRGMTHAFRLCHTHETFYYRLDAPGELGPSAPPGGGGDARELPAEVEPGAWVAQIERAAARIETLSRSTEAETSPERRAGGRSSADLSAALDLLHKEQFAEALDRVRALPRGAAPDPDAMLLEAVLLTSSGRFTEAERVCQSLLGLDELNAGAHYVLALCSAGAGRLDRAVHHDRVATYLDPGFAMPRLHLGLMLRREGDRSRARQELGQARTLLEREDGARLALFGGGFNRHALLALCDAELELTAGTPGRGTRAARGSG